MSHKIYALITVSIMFSVTGLPAAAETPDQARIKQLERENSELRQELAQLRLELSQLKREMKEAPTESNPGSSDQQAAEKDLSTDSKVDSKKKTKSRAFRSADEICRLIPEHIRPAIDGWDNAQTRTVSEWLKDNIHGKRFEARKKIDAVTVKYDTYKRIWTVVLSFDDEKMTYKGWKMQEKIAAITLVGDKAFSEAAQKRFKAGANVNVSGTITSVRWDSYIRRKPGENWHPTFLSLTLDADQPK